MAYELIATSDFIPSRNIFLIQIDMSDYLLEYYQHRKDLNQNITTEQDQNLKDLLACFAIHLTARAAFENHAWTLTLVSEPPYSLFATGSTGEPNQDGLSKGFLVGNILTENIRHSDSNGIHAQFTRRGKTSNSYIRSEKADIKELTEIFYIQSEQSPIKIKISENDDKAYGLVALNGYDPEWFAVVKIEDFIGELKESDKSRMRTCEFAFKCECSPQKLLPFFSSLTKSALDDLYGDGHELMITCPRCGKKFAIDRADIKIPDA